MMKLIVIVWFCLIPFWVFATENGGGYDCTATIAKLKKQEKFSDFTDEELTAICEKEQTWNTIKATGEDRHGKNEGEEDSASNSSSESTENENVGGNKFHTKEQITFLKNIFRCRGQDCFDSKWRQFLAYLKKAAPKVRVPTLEDQLPKSGRQRVATLSEDPSSIKLLRKEYRMMTESERLAFQAAVNKLKTDEIDGKSKYDLIVDFHLAKRAPQAHFSCCFLLYHRELLKQFEVALRLESPDISVPYWDSSLDSGLPNPCHSCLWTDELFGNEQGEVTTGPFKNWTPTKALKQSKNNLLYRQCNTLKGGRLLKQSDFDKINRTTQIMDVMCSCNKNYTFLELVHGSVHVFVGGHMNAIEVSPNDIIFFMHHGLIDYVFESWRLSHENRQQREQDYPNSGIGCPTDPNDDAQAPMHPFDSLNNAFGLSNSYTDIFYAYAARPSCPNNCNSPYLFCKHTQCMAKVRLGGNCTGLESFDSCCKGKCVQGVCQQVETS